MSAQTAIKQPVDLADVQGLLRHGFKDLTASGYLLLRVKNAQAARGWLARVDVTSAVVVEPETALQVAVTSSGLQALGVADDIIRGFSNEYIEGMSNDGNRNRSRRLGDVGESDTSRWQWGTQDRLPHVIVLLFATPGGLPAFQQQIEVDCRDGFDVLPGLPAGALTEREPFGFKDGISQPKPDWDRQRAVCDETIFDYTNRVCLGEFVLGYPNEYGGYTDRPLLDPRHAGAAGLPRAEDAPGKADLGRNGSYLVIRQLQQDVQRFWTFLDEQAGGDAAARLQLGAAMVGRTLDGEPLVGRSHDVIPGDEKATGGNNAFTYKADTQGLRCPLGAHVRRSNPRNADLPPGSRCPITRLVRTLGFDADALDQDHVASTRFHRLLRRGRRYGPMTTPEQALAGAAAGEEQGLYFICLGANIARQFEFVQSAWIEGAKFDGLAGEGDALLGNRLPGRDGSATDGYSIPQRDGADQRLTQLPAFVAVRGGAYCFLPGIRALRFIAGATALSRNSTAMEGSMDSNTSRPVPPANTGSALLNWISDTSMFLVQMQRRIDPFIRPAFDAVLREPLARFVTWMINLPRKNEGLRIAEEKPLPNEEAHIDAIVDTFKKQMSGLWKPGGFERGGNTKTQGIVRAEFIVHDDLAPRLRKGIFAAPRSYPAWVRFSGPGPYVTPDIDDVGFMSISVKLMDVPGAKLMDEEKFTQDMFGVSPPTFVTGDTFANTHLQEWSLKNASLFHFINFRRPHLLDLIMQGLYIKTQSSPFEAPYFSCVPYLLGDGQAMMYSFWPVSSRKTPIPRLPLRPPDDYLRNAMVAALDEGDVELDVRVQLQTDAHLMPLENAAVLWPERLSPRVSVATLRIPRQTFSSPEQIAFGKRLSFNPWHCIAEHRPLGNQSRARKRLYYELSQFRHQMNKVPHFEPDGSERFP